MSWMPLSLRGDCHAADLDDPIALVRCCAENLWSTWDPEFQQYFQGLDPQGMVACEGNPWVWLKRLDPSHLDSLRKDPAFGRAVTALHERYEGYMQQSRLWSRREASTLRARPIAYFSAEFALHPSLPIYSGGLGVLAGDHLKTASDLGIPLVGVGLFYSQGYFQQEIDPHWLQREIYSDLPLEHLPVSPVRDSDGRQVEVRVDRHAGPLYARLWKLLVGRVVLVLLDCNTPSNSPSDRMITQRLYGGDRQTRIAQEIVLGIGGVRALRALGIHPSVLHLNEGHSAFASLEWARQAMEEEGVGFDSAWEQRHPGIVFSTHTPVPAGHDRFSGDLMEEYLGPMRNQLGIPQDRLVNLVTESPPHPYEPLCMTALALRAAARTNGVSALHGRISRSMWRSLWPSRSVDEVPIFHITNGVHLGTWMAESWRHVWDGLLRKGWQEWIDQPETWEPVSELDRSQCWATHQQLKQQLLDFISNYRVQLATKATMDPTELLHEHAEVGPGDWKRDVLTIGFGRRFASYKRAHLLFQDLDRLAELIGNPKRPVQLLFAGKAHPQDHPGKAILQSIAQLQQDSRFRGRLIFLPNYDMQICRAMVQGVDLWLNTPRRPLEASGTSGQKAAINGVLHCSILDGWWAEAYDGTNGFAIGKGEGQADEAAADARDARYLMELLESQVVPLYYGQSDLGIPEGWIDRMKDSIRTCAWRFSSHRMLADYVRHSYLPAAGLIQSPSRIP